MQKIIFLLMAVLMVLLSGCSSEESKAAQEFKNTAKENFKLLQSDKSNIEIARTLAQNAYNVTCKTYKVQEPLESEEEKLMAEVNLAKAKAVLGYIDRGNQNFFSLGDKNSADKVKKDMEPALKKINEWKEKHKEYIQAVTEYNNSISKVVDLSYSRRNEDYFINPNIKGEAIQLAKSNNYKNLNFSDLNMERFLVPNEKRLEEKRMAREMREAEEARKAEERKRTESVLMGEIKDKRAELVTTPDANYKVIRPLNVGEKFIVMDDDSGGPNIKIKMLNTGEEGWIWHTYAKYDYVKKDAVPQAVQNTNRSLSSSSNVYYGIINGNEVNVRKGPGKEYQSLGVFFKGDKVRIVGEQGNNIGENWYQIEYDNPSAGLIKGWVRKDYINVSKTGETAAANQPIKIKRITGSSHLVMKEINKAYPASQIADGVIETCWSEGIPGYGVNEKLNYELDDVYEVRGFNIWTGYQKSEDLFYKNGRPIALMVRSEDGYSNLHKFNDSMGMQQITFTRPIKARYLSFTIMEVAPGKTSEDACISELSLF